MCSGYVEEKFKFHMQEQTAVSVIKVGKGSYATDVSNFIFLFIITKLTLV